MRLGWLFVFALAAHSQNSRDPGVVLAHAREHILERMERLPNYTCVETVDRSYLQPVTAGATASCEELVLVKNARKLRVTATDRLRLDVRIAGGNEVVAWAGGNGPGDRAMAEVFESGPFGTGPFAGLLGGIFADNAANLHYAGQVDGLFEYEFDVPQEASHYMTRVSNGWRATHYKGTLLIDPESFDLKRVVVTQPELPADAAACETTNAVDYQKILLGNREFLVPRHSALRFVNRDGTEALTASEYVSCHEYHAESTIHYEDEPANPVAKKPVQSGRAVPEGLAFSLSLENSIDTGTAAAGDVVTAKVRSPVHAPESKEILYPAGAIVRGRFTRMLHWEDPAIFGISIVFETLEVNGDVSPFHGQPDRKDTQQNLERAAWAGLNASNGRGAIAGMYFFPTSKP